MACLLNCLPITLNWIVNGDHSYMQDLDSPKSWEIFFFLLLTVCACVRCLSRVYPASHPMAVRIVSVAVAPTTMSPP